MTCYSRGGLSVTAVGKSICVGPPFLHQLLQHNPLHRQVRHFLNSKSMSRFSHFLSTSVQTPLPLRTFRPLSISITLLRIVDHPRSLMLRAASGIVRLHSSRANVITWAHLDPLFDTDDTGGECCFSFLLFSLNHRARSCPHAAHLRNLALRFLLRRFAIFPVPAGRVLYWGKIHCFHKGVHNHLVWMVVHYHQRL